MRELFLLPMKKHVPSSTAEAAAMIRSLALSNPDTAAILADPCAGWFCGPKTILPYWHNRLLVRSGNLANWSKGMLAVGFMFPLCRHRYFNDLLQKSLDEGFRQVVVLGAGYDASALRFSHRLKGVSFFEVDHPSTQARKRAVLERRHAADLSDARYIPVDLSCESLRNALGGALTPAEPVLVIAEGLLSYLPDPALQTVIADVAALSDRVRFAFDYRRPSLNESNSLGRRWLHNFKNRGECYRTFYSADQAEAVLVSRRFRVLSHVSLAAVWRELCLELPVPTSLEDVAGVITAEAAR